MKAATPLPLRSRLYDCEVLHSRLHPIRHRFRYRYFTFCVDLDEIEALERRYPLFGYVRWRPFRWVGRDFIFGARAHTPQEFKSAVIEFAARQGTTDPIYRVELVAHLRTLGYAYNPAAFYYCYGAQDELLCAIVEVTNTFREKKAYYVPNAGRFAQDLRASEPKRFYVSPFVGWETAFKFRLRRPDAKLFIQIESEQAVNAVVMGKARPFSTASLWFCLLRYPLIPLVIMGRIHLQAVRLFLKGVPYFKKAAPADLPKGGTL